MRSSRSGTSDVDREPYNLKQRISKTRLLMNPLEQHLTQYAAYHRDRRNIATHFAGIPMIVVAIMSFLARPAVSLSELPFLELSGGQLPGAAMLETAMGLAGHVISPALALCVAGSLYYLRLDLRFGLLMSILNVLALWLGAQIAALDWSQWLGWSLGIFIGGWALQALGHYWEGRKPAFMDDIRGLIIGPLFVVAEAGFALGFRRQVAMRIEASAGPTR